MYAQVIDDVARTTLVSIDTRSLEKDANAKKSECARKAGSQLAELLKKQHVKTVVFDRGRFAYNGRIKQFAEGLREAGITV